MQAEMGLKNPVDSIYTLELIARKTVAPKTSNALTFWVLNSLRDGVEHDVWQASELSHNALCGKTRSMGGKGILDIAVFKHEFLLHFLGEFSEKLATVAKADADMLRAVYKSHKAYRIRISDLSFLGAARVSTLWEYRIIESFMSDVGGRIFDLSVSRFDFNLIVFDFLMA